MTERAGRRPGLVPERWKVEAAGLLWAWAMRLDAASRRQTVLGWERIVELERSGARVMIVVWHGCYRALLSGVRAWPAVLVSTDTFRGRIIEAAAKRLGHRCVLRPEGLRGEDALRWLQAALRDARRVVVVADGPAGPARRVKRGVVELAARLRLSVVPCGTASRWFYSRERWDAQEIPLPFAPVAVVFGSALAIRMGDDIAAWREGISRALDGCLGEARTCVGRARRQLAADAAATGTVASSEASTSTTQSTARFENASPK